MTEPRTRRMPMRVSAVAAYASVAIAIFFAAYIASVDRRLADLEAEVGHLRAETTRLREAAASVPEPVRAAEAATARPEPDRPSPETPLPERPSVAEATPALRIPGPAATATANSTATVRDGSPEATTEAETAAGDTPAERETPPEKEAETPLVRAVSEAAPAVEPAALPPRGLEARILESGPGGRRFFLGAGRIDGVRQGQRFTVWRDGVYVGELRARRIFRSLSACDVITRMDGGIRYGDTARAVPLRLLNPDG